MSVGVNSGETTVSNVAIVKLTATSPPAINVYKFADVPLGTVPAGIITAAISGNLFINKNAITRDILTFSVHFNKKPIKSFLGCFTTLSNCSVYNDITIKKKINLRQNSVKL